MRHLRMHHCLAILLLGMQLAMGQSIKGNFPALKAKEILLKGYEGFQERTLGTTTTDSLGHFTITYPKTYTGAALMQIKDGASLIVLLNNENLQMDWQELQDFSTLKFNNSPENDAFSEGMRLYGEAEQKLAALKYLLPQYEKEPTKKKWIHDEITVQEGNFARFTKSLPKNSYAAYYLTLRGMLSDMPMTANRYIDRMPKHEKDFKAIDFNDDRLWHSGLYGQLLEGFYQLMESHGNLETVYAHANPATDAWISSLKSNPGRQLEVSEYAFKLLEKRSLFGAAEHLAKKMLDESSCQADNKRTDLFEQYRKLAVGNTAPDIQLADGKTLSALEARYKLVVFGASWCPNCQGEYPALKSLYPELKAKFGLEIFYISIDTDKAAFDSQYSDAPFVTYTDLKGWDTQAAKDYHVFATPTMLLLDKERKILMKIKSPDHLKAFLEAIQ